MTINRTYTLYSLYLTHTPYLDSDVKQCTVLERKYIDVTRQSYKYDNAITIPFAQDRLNIY